MLDLTWDYPTRGPLDEPDAEAVLQEINGRDLSRLGGEAAGLLSGYTELRADGSTSCGCWIYSGCFADGVNQTARRKPGSEQSWVAPEWAWAWPLNRRMLYNRASADPDGRPWSERKRYVWWDSEHERWTGEDVPDFKADMAPDYEPAGRSHGRGGTARGRAFRDAGRRARLAVRADRSRRRSPADALRAARVAVPKRAVRSALEPGADPLRARGEPLQSQRRRAGGRGLPVRGHDLPADRAPHGRGDVTHAALPRRAAARDVL